MTLKTFRNVSRFQVFVPEKRGWLRYRPSWNEPGVWHCEFAEQDGSNQKRKLITAAYAEDIWLRYRSMETCETTFFSYDLLLRS